MKPWNVCNKGDMPCRHPYGKCRFMIGRKKPYTKPALKRTCGVADPDSVCKRISRTSYFRINFDSIK
jgi:hypothetical protein